MVDVEFDLSWAVKQKILLVARKIPVQLIREPIQIVVEILHSIKQTAVGAEVELLLHVVSRNKIAYVNVGGVGEVLGGRIEVDDADRFFTNLEVLAHEGAVGGLSGAGRPHDHLTEAGHSGLLGFVFGRGGDLFLDLVVLWICSVLDGSAREEFSWVKMFTIFLDGYVQVYRYRRCC